MEAPHLKGSVSDYNAREASTYTRPTPGPSLDFLIEFRPALSLLLRSLGLRIKTALEADAKFCTQLV